MARTRRATFLPLRMAAAAAMSDKRPLVQLPMTTWSIFTFSAAASSMVLVFSGRWGKATVGRMAERSIVDDLLVWRVCVGRIHGI